MKKVSQRKIQQIGLWKNGINYECVWFDEENKPYFCYIKEPIPLDYSSLFVISNQTEYCLKFITAILPQKTWTKTLLLPEGLNSTECEQQCHFLLSQELPIPIEDIWFDYQSEQMKQGFKLTIFAIKKQIATDYISTYTPLPIDVLDCCINSLVRAFQYFTSNQLEHHHLYLYLDEQYAFAINVTPQQIRFIQQTEKNLMDIVNLFCQRYTFSPKQIYVYHTKQNQQTLPKHWKKIETNLPFIALGNALWQ